MPSVWAAQKHRSERVWLERINFCRAWDVTVTRRSFFLCMDAEKFLSVFAGESIERVFWNILWNQKFFCRLCAVFGGVYCLKRSITEIYFINNDTELVFDAIQCDKQKIQAKNIVFGHGTISSARFPKATDADHLTKPEAEKYSCGKLSRGIFITDTPLGDENLNSGGGGVIFLRMPSADGNTEGAFVIQLSHWSGCCPKGYCKLTVTLFFFSNKVTTKFP